MQRTITKQVAFDGIGLHSGKPVRMTLMPKPANHGIVFVRTDVARDAQDLRSAVIPARWDLVTPSQLCTLMRNAQGVELSTVEHIMAALAGLGITNVLIEVDGPEVPILDGSAAPFVRGLIEAGLVAQEGPTRVLKILKQVEYRVGDAVARLEPAQTTEIDFRIAFEDSAIGAQDKRLSLANGAFVRELSNCRTFCRQSDVEAMRANGLALGGVPGENAIVFDGDMVESGAGLRFEDEPVRHKMLDALGDLYLAGAPLLGRYVGDRAGHAITNGLLRTLFDTPGAWAFVNVDAQIAAGLPGAGVTQRDLSYCA